MAGASVADVLSEISALLDRGRADAALGMIERCRQAGSDPWLVRLEVERGRALAILGEYEEAERVLRETRAQLASMAEDDGVPALLALAACDAALGEMCHRRTDFRRAIDHFGVALASLREARQACLAALGPQQAAQQGRAGASTDSPCSFGTCTVNQIGREIARASVMQAESLMSCGEFAKASDLVDEALATFSECGDVAWRGRAAKAKGTIAWYQDRFDEALSWYERAEADLALTDMSVQAAFVDNNRALVYWKINQPAEAVRLFEKARPVIASAGMETEAATIDVNTSIALASLGRTSEALALLDRAGEVFERLGVRQKAGWVEYYRGKILAQTGHVREAMARFAAARTRFQDESIDTYRAQATLYLGLCHIDLGELDEGRVACQEALDVALARGVPDLAFPALYGLARATEPANPSRALELYGDAIREIERMRRSLEEDRLKTSFVLDKTRVYDAAVSLAVELGRHDDALAFVERAKSQAFLDSVRALGRGRGTEGGDSPGAADSPLVFAARCLFGADVLDAIVEYYLLPRRLLIFVMTPIGGTDGKAPLPCCERERVRLLSVSSDLDPSALADLVAGLYADIDIMQATPREFVASNMLQLLASFNDHARSLYSVLIRPVEEPLSGLRRILIVPHGLLHHVPFHALHDGRGYVIDSREVLLAPSLGTLEALWKRGRRTIRTCLAVGASDDAAPLADAECRRIVELFGPGNGKLLLGADATASAFSKSAAEFDVVHVAGHAVFDANDPMRSSIKLADGVLSAADLFGTRMDCALVMLSACQTGVAYVSSGDELLGLSRAVFRAGASSLVASLWKVNDESTAALAVEFYSELLRGRTKTEALRGAALRVRERYPHPYYWAPFVLLGDPRAGASQA